MKKSLFVIITITLVLLFGSCGSTPAAGSGSPYKDGTFIGMAEGFKGPLSVTVTIVKGKITVVKVDAHAETPGISDPAIAGIPAAVVKKQSTQVDVISNATYTSKGIIAAVDNALGKAKN